MTLSDPSAVAPQICLPSKDNDIVIVALVLNLRCESLWLIAAFGTNYNRHQRLAPVRHSYCWMRHHRLLA